MNNKEVPDIIILPLRKINMRGMKLNRRWILLVVLLICVHISIWPIQVEAKSTKPNKIASFKSTSKKVSTSKSSSKETKQKTGDEGYKMLADYSIRYGKGKTSALRDYSPDEVSRAIGALSSAQQAWKSMDGATHSLKNTFKESTSLQSRFRRFVERKSKNTKEAVKLFEYITTVERGLQTCEILQAVAIEGESSRQKQLQSAGLQEIGRFHFQENKLKITVSLLIPQQQAIDKKLFQKNEVIISIVDHIDGKNKLVQSVAQWLRLVTVEKSTSVTVAEDVDLEIQPTVLNLAKQVAKELNTHLQQLSNVTPDKEAEGTELSTNVTSTMYRKNLKLCVLGHSTGGAVAAYLSMMLDGFLNSNIIPSLSDVDSNEVTSSATEQVPKPRSLIGSYRRRVICRVLGPPPCIGRSIVPRFVTSIICGDDIMPRATSLALQSCQRRILEALESGAGRKNMAWLAAPGLLRDLSNVASSNLNKYKGRKKEQTGLQLPGRVFFIKSRQLKQGATMQRILRGNWQEEVLWNIHDIVISSKLLDHHSLDAYIRTLNRC